MLEDLIVKGIEVFGLPMKDKLENVKQSPVILEIEVLVILFNPRIL